MKALVTGAHGFIGHQLVNALYDRDIEAIRVDPVLNFARVSGADYRCRIQDALFTTSTLLDGVTHVFHLGARPGVGLSWNIHTVDYFENNAFGTQVLLDFCMRQPHPPRVIYASSSSVVGNGDGPISPYGVSKKAGEDLMRVYALRGVHTVSLRYFTVYGPGQRPDMAFRKWIDAALKGEPLKIYGDGYQTRSFTFVDDVVDATIKAATAEVPAGSVFDVGGFEPHTLHEAVSFIKNSLKLELLTVQHLPAQPGDPQIVIPDLDRTGELLGYWPQTHLRDGLERQIAWQREAVTVSRS